MGSQFAILLIPLISTYIHGGAGAMAGIDGQAQAAWIEKLFVSRSRH